MSDIRLTYLKTGEQLLGDVTYSESLNSYSIRHPLLVVPVETRKLGFMDYLQMVDTDTVTFEGADVRHCLEPSQEVINYWNAQFGSGIQVPGGAAGQPAQIITG